MCDADLFTLGCLLQQVKDYVTRHLQEERDLIQEDQKIINELHGAYRTIYPGRF